MARDMDHLAALGTHRVGKPTACRMYQARVIKEGQTRKVVDTSPERCDQQVVARNYAGKVITRVKRNGIYGGYGKVNGNIVGASNGQDMNVPFHVKEAIKKKKLEEKKAKELKKLQESLDEVEIVLTAPDLSEHKVLLSEVYPLV